MTGSRNVALTVIECIKKTEIKLPQLQNKKEKKNRDDRRLTRLAYYKIHTRCDNSIQGAFFYFRRHSAVIIHTNIAVFLFGTVLFFNILNIFPLFRHCLEITKVDMCFWCTVNGKILNILLYR